MSLAEILGTGPGSPKATQTSAELSGREKNIEAIVVSGDTKPEGRKGERMERNFLSPN